MLYIKRRNVKEALKEGYRVYGKIGGKSFVCPQLKMSGSVYMFPTAGEGCRHKTVCV